MNQLSKRFAECLISASKFAAPSSNKENPLRFVSIRKIDGGYEICGTDGIVLSLYKVKDDHTDVDLVEAYADFSKVKIKKGSKVANALFTSFNGVNGILISLVNGKKTENIFVPVVKNINYVSYHKHDLFKIQEKYGCWAFNSASLRQTLSCLNSEVVETVDIHPNENNPYYLNLSIYADKSPSVKIGVFNVTVSSVSREKVKRNDGSVGEVDSPRYFNLKKLSGVIDEASDFCVLKAELHMAGIIDPVHIRNYSEDLTGSNFKQDVYAHYMIMSINRA